MLIGPSITESKGESMKKVVLFLTLAVAGFWLAPSAWAENADDIEILKQQIQQMQQQLQQQEMMIQQQDRKIKDMEQQQPVAPGKYVNMEDIVARVQEQLPPVDGLTIGKGKIRVTPYGFIRLDAAYDDSAVFMFSGNVVGWAWPEGGDTPFTSAYGSRQIHRDNDDNFAMTATGTRLGLNFDGPEFAGGDIFGKIEVDFDELSNNGGDVVAHRIRMRHAYAELKYPTWSFLAGQTWDVVAPRIPHMLDCVVMWGSGNIGYRRPQLRLTKKWDLEGTLLTAQASINHADRTWNGGDDFDGDLLLNGVESGWPMGEARIGLDTVILGGRKLGIVLSGAIAKEQSELKDNASEKDEFDEWVVALDAGFTIIPGLVSLQGEVYTGQDVDNLYGGIVQGFLVKSTAPLEFEEVEATGGWFAANVTPLRNLQFNFGYGIDHVDNEDDLQDFSTADKPKISQNWTAFGNVIWAVVPNFDIGLELAYHDTKWTHQPDGDDFRVQTAFIYKF
jgi:cell division protein FtsB